MALRAGGTPAPGRGAPARASRRPRPELGSIRGTDTLRGRWIRLNATSSACTTCSPPPCATSVCPGRLTRRWCDWRRCDARVPQSAIRRASLSQRRPAGSHRSPPAGVDPLVPPAPSYLWSGDLLRREPWGVEGCGGSGARPRRPCSGPLLPGPPVGPSGQCGPEPQREKAETTAAMSPRRLGRTPSTCSCSRRRFPTTRRGRVRRGRL